jgi:hypothetical protein
MLVSAASARHPMPLSSRRRSPALPPVTDPTRIALKKAIEVTSEAPDETYLLLDWLNALITRWRYADWFRWLCRVDRGQPPLWPGLGEPVDRARHMPEVEPAKRRVPTRPTAASRERRRETKVARGRTKRLRQPLEQPVE